MVDLFIMEAGFQDRGSQKPTMRTNIRNKEAKRTDSENKKKPSDTTKQKTETKDKKSQSQNLEKTTNYQ
jgi:Skp family chaperone for outer membrane proteins